VQIELEKTVAAKPAEAFAILTNIADWPRIIGSIREVEVLTPGPIRVGTRIREERIMFGREVTQDLEIKTIERPHRLRLWSDESALPYELDHVVDAIYGGGCRMMLIFRSRPGTSPERALQPFAAPFMGITLRDELERDLADLAAAVARRGSLDLVRSGRKPG
jgi:hypothetical protein